MVSLAIVSQMLSDDGVCVGASLVLITCSHYLASIGFPYSVLALRTTATMMRMSGTGRPTPRERNQTGIPFQPYLANPSPAYPPLSRIGAERRSTRSLFSATARILEAERVSPASTDETGT